MENQTETKTALARNQILIIAALILIILTAAVLIWQTRFGRKPPPKEAVQSVPSVPTVPNVSALEGQTFLPPGQLPEGITSDMILAEDAEIIQNYEFINSQNGFKQSTVRFTSQKDLNLLVESYNRYFASHQWAFLGEAGYSGEGLVNLVGVKVDKRLNLTFSVDPLSQKTIVDITLANLVIKPR